MYALFIYQLLSYANSSTENLQRSPKTPHMWFPITRKSPPHKFKHCTAILPTLHTGSNKEIWSSMSPLQG